MNLKKYSKGFLPIGVAIALATLSFTASVRANVYATNVKLNGSLTGTSAFSGGGLAISYILNEAASSGVTIKILSGATVVNTINIASGSAGTLRGLNNVACGATNSSGANLPAGTYSVSITAAATGFPQWTQTSIDTNSGMPANYPLGIAVDNNTNSVYYGRVVIGNAIVGTNPNIPAAANMVGLYKMNADGTQADEGWYGNASYTNDDGGNAPAAGQMPNSGGYDPMIIRIGEDDRIYWVDNGDLGAIVATDMQATTNQVVICEGGPGFPGGGHDVGPSYSANPDFSDLVYGFQEFDVSATTTTNAAVWLADNDYPNWGVWMYHMTNGTADPADTGSQAVTTGGDLAIVSSGGVMVDYNLDIFVGQDRYNDNAFYDSMEFTNWNGGVLPPEGSGFNFATGYATGQVNWGYGCGVDTTCSTDPSQEALRDCVINSRVNPTILAMPMTAGAQAPNGNGIRLLNATNGSVIIVTNGLGATIQTLTNLDWGQQYAAAAWDNVGNLYGASTSLNVWRVFSPPGANTNTTVAVGTVTVATPLAITSIVVNGTTVTINFNGSASDAASAFTLLSSAAVTPASGYSADGGATITQVSPGVFKAVTTASGANRFYRIKR
jgi:hypothetical protein